MKEDLREAMLNMMQASSYGIVALDTTADELVRSANILQCQPVFEAMRDLAQQQQVKALEMQGRLAAFSDAYIKSSDG